ncbi:hypothetical protein Rfer_4372 (plasmid) [Rhodoferax ferrireducens T118]|uniref:Uncharacterized protein n=2 Tax=Rhodoferax ferrireducens TaxID=192843 RepID=Q21Q87_ALBFT|nr:hypothetical protein Rfer_4372 [Rhodoferax ferrireducens T118]
MRALKGRYQTFINLTLPIRWHYACDQARYALCCEEEVCDHYGVAFAKAGQFRIYVRGFMSGITRGTIPDYFIDGWFRRELDLAPDQN